MCALASKEIEGHITFHRHLSEDDADKRLKAEDKDCHLTRYGSNRDIYVLSVVNIKRKRETLAFGHFEVEFEERNGTTTYKLKGNRKTKKQFRELLEHFKSSGVNSKIKSIGTEIKNPNEEVQCGDRSWEMELVCEHPSYHDDISGDEAKDMLTTAALELNRCGTNYYFLTRYSNFRENYVLAVLKCEDKRERSKFKQFNIIIYEDERKCEIEGTGEKRDNMFELEKYFKNKRISRDIREIGSYLNAETGDIALETIDGLAMEVFYDMKPHQQPSTEASPQHPTPQHTPSTKDLLLQPTLKYLNLLKWHDGREEKRLKIIAEISDQWENVGVHLGQTNADFDRYRASPSSISMLCSRVIDTWIESGGLPSPEYPITWRGVYDLLLDIELKDVADIMTTALASHGIDIPIPEQESPRLPTSTTILPPQPTPTPLRLPLEMRFLINGFKWKDEAGRKQKFKLAAKVSAKWRKIGLQINLEPNSLDTFEREDRSIERRWEKVMQEWWNGKGGELYPVTWETLYKILEDVDCSKIAEDLMTAVENALL